MAFNLREEADKDRLTEGYTYYVESERYGLENDLEFVTCYGNLLFFCYPWNKEIKIQLEKHNVKVYYPE